MNAPAKSSYFHAPVTGELLHSGWQHTDHLQLDLYGLKPIEDDGYEVTGVTVHGHNIDISELFTGMQLVQMGKWLDFRDDTNPTLRRVAENAKHDAMRGPWESGRGIF